MKLPLLFTLALAAPLFAGTEVTSSKQVIQPAEQPALWSWFAGGSIGYLNDFDEEMYHLHAGVDTSWSVAGWNVALFGEVGYTEKEESYFSPQSSPSQLTSPDTSSFDVDSMGAALQAVANGTLSATGFELDVIPLTFNVKFERPLTGNLNAYFGAGLGLARVDLDLNVGLLGQYSDNDWVFAAQAFAGLNYNVNANVEIYGGLRWLTFDEAELSDGGESATLDLGDDFLFELGARYNF